MHSHCVVGVVVAMEVMFLVAPENEGKVPDVEPEGKGVDVILA